jgi:predicted membrane channel-forming protein YqfA (hemolysin III family)
MSAWTYYAPFWLGTLCPAIVYCFRLTSMPNRPIWAHLLAPVFFIITGVVLQLGVIGLQGVFAHVLPVPRGRSIRGRVATAVGCLLLSWFVLGGMAMLIGLLSESPILFLVLVVSSGISLLVAATTYALHIPAAVHDF